MMLLRVDPHEVEVGDFILGLGVTVERIEFARCRWRFYWGVDFLPFSVPLGARVTIHRDKKG